MFYKYISGDIGYVKWYFRFENIGAFSAGLRCLVAERLCSNSFALASTSVIVSFAANESTSTQKA